MTINSAMPETNNSAEYLFLSKKEATESSGNIKKITGVVLFITAGGCVLSPPIFMGALTGVAINVGSQWIQKGLRRVVTQDDITQDEIKDEKFFTRTFLLNPVASCVLFPVIEELLFRVYLQGAILSNVTIDGVALNSNTVVAVASACFGSCHLLNGKGFEVQSLVATISGVALGVMYLQYGPMAPIVAHIINNTLVMTKATDCLYKKAD